VPDPRGRGLGDRRAAGQGPARVEQDEVGRAGAQLGRRVGDGVDRADVEPATPEGAGDGVAERGGGVDDQDAGHGAGCSGAG
jgi:hypothetical protein